MIRPLISLVAALGENRVIGQGNGLPWHLPVDMAWFKKITQHKPVLMGRKTYDAIGHPLQDRLNIVVSRQKTEHEPYLFWVSSIEDGLSLAADQSASWGPEIMVIGGAQIFEQTLSMANRLYLTEIHRSYDGDTFFPDFDKNQWQRKILATYPLDIENPSFTIVQYDRN